MKRNKIRQTNTGRTRHQKKWLWALRQNFRILSAAALVFVGWWGQAGAEIVDVSELVIANDIKVERSALVVSRLNDKKSWVSNPARVQQRFSPASTSKIPHMLIALEHELAKPGTMFVWDGKPKGLDGWNRDHSLSSAFSNSVVWVYQSIAQRAGRQTMADGLTSFGYGNADVGSEEQLTSYWLDDTLLISAHEQIVFLSKLASEQLPLSTETYKDARNIMTSDTGAGWRMYSKSGWRHGSDIMDIGWFVGWVECSSETYVFALNMDMPNPSYVAKRKQVTMAVLREIGALDCS